MAFLHLTHWTKWDFERQTKRSKAQRGAGRRRLSGWLRKGPGYTHLSFQTHLDTHSHPGNGDGDHCLLEARHSGDIMTAAIVCQYWDRYFIMDWQSSSSSLWLRRTVRVLRRHALAGQMWHLASRCPAGHPFQLEEEIMTWLTLPVGEMHCVPNVTHDL